MRKYDNYCKALINLHEGTKLQPPYTIVERTGIIGLFEICFELSWKVMKECLEEQGRSDAQTGSPRAIIKIAYQCNMIGDEQTWLEILEARNILSHTYSDEQSMSVIDDIKNSFINAFDALKTELSEHWLGE